MTQSGMKIVSKCPEANIYIYNAAPGIATNIYIQVK